MPDKLKVTVSELNITGDSGRTDFDLGVFKIEKLTKNKYRSSLCFAARQGFSF